MTALLMLASCEKEDAAFCADEEVFCNLVADQDFDGTGPVIDGFLDKLADNDAKALDKLNDWLACKSCVERAEILCRSCIYTDPAQSEIRVTFKAGGERVVLVLDILMDEKLKFHRYHESSLP